jgi:hypothetical protein
MFQPQGKHLVYSLISLPTLSIIFPIFLHNTLNTIWTTTSFNYKYLSMHVHTSHQCYEHPPFTLCPWQWVNRNSWCSSQHFVAIARNANFHVGQEQVHTLPSTTFHFFRRQVEIVFTKNEIRTLTNVVIANPMGEFTLILCNPRICYLWNNSSQRHELLRLTPH